MGSIYSSIKKSCESLTRIASSLECHQASSSRPRKSPRLIDQAQRQELIEAETEKGNDRESKLEQRRVHAREKRSALTEQEIDRDLERRRNVYQRRRQQTVVGIEGNLPTRFSNLRQSPGFLNRDRMDEPGPSTTGASTSTTFTSQATFIPRRSPRISGQVERREVDIEKERDIHQGMTGASFSNNSKGKAVALVPGIVEHQHGDVHAAEASRKRKGKSVAVYQAPKQRRANNCVPGRNTSKAIVIGSRDGENDNRDQVDHDISSDDGDHYKIDTSDDDVVADDANQIRRSV